MPSTKKILLIENQKTQFMKICKCLKEEMGGVDPECNDKIEIIPEKNVYDGFINNVRIALDIRYDTYCDNALKQIDDYIACSKPDLIILDHILLSVTLRRSCIDNPDAFNLLNKLYRTKEDNKKIPVLFLSSNLEGDEEVSEQLQSLREEDIECLWVTKSYPRTPEVLGNSTYFKKEVLPKIKKLLINTECRNSGELDKELEGILQGVDNSYWPDNKEHYDESEITIYAKVDTFLKKLDQYQQQLLQEFNADDKKQLFENLKKFLDSDHTLTQTDTGNIITGLKGLLGDE